MKEKDLNQFTWIKVQMKIIFNNKCILEKFSVIMSLDINHINQSHQSSCLPRVL